MLPRLSSHRIVCACLFLVTSLLVTVVAGPLIAKPDQLERRTPVTPSVPKGRNIQVIRIGFQKPGSETYAVYINKNTPSGYNELRLTIFFGSTGLQPHIVTHKDNNTPGLDSEIKIVDAPRKSAAAGKSKGDVMYYKMMNIGPDSDSLWCAFIDPRYRTLAFEIMTNVERLKAETNKLLQSAQVSGSTQVHVIEDDLDYINTCLLFLTLFRNAAGNPVVKDEELNVWRDLYLRLRRERGSEKR
ncbi:hypothetical protein DFH05DRAFT_1558513 [Lentinula detonsa]|uniref:Uncharacterized protein n=1 Tax=Lentinula detonsa TaxID=2804962 RepID=A0A9W8NWY2_9AGAR|nr:hypothetical protein DFH05DRAFT_1558513 [Lentinula detonsa]